jgi:two-component system, NarL family, invasion response regulator UvrY
VSPVQVLTVDDQRVFRDAARVLIEATPGFAVAGEAASGEEAIEAVRTLAPDLVLLDVRMPGLDGIETANRIAGSGCAAVVVLVTGHERDDVRLLAEESGAVALVQKESLRPRVLRELWAANRPTGAPHARH